MAVSFAQQTTIRYVTRRKPHIENAIGIKKPFENGLESTIAGEPPPNSATSRHPVLLDAIAICGPRYLKHSPVFVFPRGSPVGNASDRATRSTAMVRFVGLSQPFKLSVFSVDRSAFVDRPVERVGRSGDFRTAAQGA